MLQFKRNIAVAVALLFVAGGTADAKVRPKPKRTTPITLKNAKAKFMAERNYRPPRDVTMVKLKIQPNREATHFVVSKNTKFEKFVIIHNKSKKMIVLRTPRRRPRPDTKQITLKIARANIQAKYKSMNLSTHKMTIERLKSRSDGDNSHFLVDKKTIFEREVAINHTTGKVFVYP